MFFIRDAALDRDALVGLLRDDRAGAMVVFEGWVRDHNDGKKVKSLEYQVYEELALKEGLRILEEAKAKFALHQVSAAHRQGHLRLGEVAVWVGAVASHRDEAFKATRFVIDEIKKRLPVWKKEHYAEHAAEWVYCAHSHQHQHVSETEYYRKQSGLIQQDLLKNSSVVVVGAGGLGCPVLTNLAMAGVGKIKIIDFDRIDLSNLHRQPLYSPTSVGEQKALVARDRVKELNPFIEVEADSRRVDAMNVDSVIADVDLILDCTDNLATKFLLHDAAFRSRTPLISASLYRYEGVLRTFDPEQDVGCLRCTVEQAPDDRLIGNCNDAGVLGATASVLGSLQASEAIQFLLRRANASLLETIFLDLRSLTQTRIKNTAKENCRSCRGEWPRDEVLGFEIGAHEISSEYVSVDIRNRSDEVLDQYLHSTRKIAVLCHRGIRSYGVVKVLREKGYPQFYSIRGGAESLPS